MRRLLRRWDGALGPWALLVALALLLFWPLFLGRPHLVPFHVFAGDPALAGLDVKADRPDWRTYDPAPVTVQYAEKSLVARALGQGELPLWNPYNGLGSPLLADGQSQPLAPFFLPFLAWPNPWVYSLVLVAQLIFGGIGMERLLKALGCGPWARAVGAAAFAFNPYTLKYLAYCNVWAYVWFPWVFWAAWRMAADPRAWRGFAVAVALMGMSGHPEEAFMGAVAGFLFYAIQAWARGGAPALWRPSSLLGPAAALGLSAWWVLPFLEWVRGSWSPRMGGHAPIPYDPAACFLLASELLWLPALLALAMAGGRSRLVALGFVPPLLWALVLLFPWPAALQRIFDLGFMSGRYSRSLAWFALTALAGLGMEAWLAGRVRGWVKWAGAPVFPAWAALALWAMAAGAGRGGNAGLPRVPLAGAPAAGSVAVWVLVGAGLAIWLLPEAWQERHRPLLASALAAVVLGGTLLSPPGAWASWNGSRPRLAPALGENPPGTGRVWLPHDGLRVTLTPSLSALFGLRDIRYVSPLTPRRMKTLAGDVRLGFLGFLDWRPDVMDFAGVAMKWEAEGLALRALPNPRSLPRGFWVPSAHRAAGPEDALRQALSDGAWRRTAFLESGSVAASAPSAAGAPLSRVEARTAVVIERCDASVWQVNCPAGGWFILRDLFWPGWRATVDGARAPILAADGVFRAVAVPAGHHQVAFEYLPVTFLTGVLVSLVVIVFLGIDRLRLGRAWWRRV